MSEQDRVSVAEDSGPRVQQIKSRRTLLAIAGVALLPMVAAYFVYFTKIGMPDNTVNHGALLEQAMTLEDIVPADVWQRMMEDKKWRLLLPVGARCDDSCQSHLYTTRQVHIRLSEKGKRLERFALNVGGEQGRAFLSQIAPDHPLLKVIDLPEDQWLTWRDRSALLAGQAQAFYLLVDQEGRAMMMYSDQHGNELLKDIKRALKYSIDYQS